MSRINIIIDEISKKTEIIMNEYLKQKYFLVVLGSIFLFGIVAKIVTVSIYDRLLKKSENMISTKNKTLQQIKVKYENSKTVNGAMANPSLMVERYIGKYRFLGISLKSISKITQRCGLISLLLGAMAGLYVYDVHKMATRATVYVISGFVMAYALDLFARAGDIEQKHKEIVYMITDFLENRMDIRDRRIERVARLSEQLDEMSESRVNIKENQEKKAMISGEDALIFNPQPEVVHIDMEQWEKQQEKAEKERKKAKAKETNWGKLEYQEMIINEVLAEFL